MPAAEPVDDAVPVACSLTAAGLAVQAECWRRLIATAMQERAVTSDGLRLTFGKEPAISEELRRLVAVEAGCCPWADWEVHTTATHLVLEIRSTGQGITTLHGMFGSEARR